MSQPLDPDAWEALSPLFDTALDLDPAARAAWLVELERQRPDIAAQLRLMLERDARAEAEGFLVSAARQTTAELLASPEARALGPWRLERPIGQGGMGTV